MGASAPDAKKTTGGSVWIIAGVVVGFVLGVLLGYAIKPAKDTTDVEQRMDMLEQELLQIREETSEIEGALTGGREIEEVRCSIYMSIPDIPGDCNETMYKDWIEVVSWSCGMVKESDVTAPEFARFTVTKYVDKSSPKLAKALCSGTQFDRVVLVMVSGDGSTMTYALTKVVIVAVSTYPPSLGVTGVEMEDVSFMFQKIEWVHVTPVADGEPSETVSGGWDLVENRPT